MYETLDPEKITWVWETITETDEQMIEICRERGWSPTSKCLIGKTPNGAIVSFYQRFSNSNRYTTRKYRAMASSITALKDTYDESELEEAKATAMHLYDTYLTRIKRELDLVAK